MNSPSHPYEGKAVSTRPVGRHRAWHRIPDKIRDEIDELNSLGLPETLIARRVGVVVETVTGRLQQQNTRPKLEAVASARHERIVAHIAAYPNKSLFGGDE